MSKWKHITENMWDCKEVDWNEYEDHRPPYTDELYKIIFEHHEAHGGQYDLALDIGAGGGTVGRILLKKFRHVIWSDQSEEYMTRAKTRFQKETEAGTMTFLQRKFDEFKPEQDLPDGKPVDMITAGTCIHFANAAQVMTQLGPLLRSGGTIAAFSYGAIPIAPLGDPAGPLIIKCKDKMVRWISDTVRPLSGHEGPGTSQARYKNIDFDPDMWKNVRRITSLLNEPNWPDWIPPAASRVREGESSEVVHDDFITKEVDFDFFPKYFYNFGPMLPLLEQIEDELDELKAAMGDRKIIVKWPVMIALATKR